MFESGPETQGGGQAQKKGRGVEGKRKSKEKELKEKRKDRINRQEQLAETSREPWEV